MKQSYRIRLARDEDAAEIAEIYRPHVEQETISFEEVAPDAAEFRRRIADVMKKHAWLVAEDNGRLAGYAYSSVHRERAAYRWVAEVSVYIREDYRRKSLATALYNALHAIMRRQGYARSYAGMTIPNEASRKFHTQYGYASFAVYNNSGFKFGKWHSTEWFVLDLLPETKEPNEIKSVENLEPGYLKEVFASAI